MEPPAPHRPVRRGFTLVEAALSVLAVSLVTVVALEATATSARMQKSMADRRQAGQLADSLLGEVSARLYLTPTDTTGLLGTLANVNDRINMLGVETYSNFIESPPRSRDGTAIASTSWRRTCTVVFVDPAAPGTTCVTDKGLRRITVEVYRNNTLVASRVAFRAAD
jgi:Tfp pilus assembly protein PilX